MFATHVLSRELKRFLPWHQARLDCLSRLIVALIQARTVNLTQRALAFDGGRAERIDLPILPCDSGNLRYFHNPQEVCILPIPRIAMQNSTWAHPSSDIHPG